MDTLQKGRVLGAIILIAGTTIGAGMLALPVVTAAAGFIPSMFLMIACWLYMTYTAFLTLEANLWVPANANIITMAKTTLGPIGAAVAWVSYLCLLYALIAAYVSGGSSLLTEGIGVVLPQVVKELPIYFTPILFVVLFSFLLLGGMRVADISNRIFFAFLVFVTIFMLWMITPALGEQSFLGNMEPAALLPAVAVLFTAFGFHIVIPSLRRYLNDDIFSLRKSILIGSAIPLVVYLLWEFLILGVVPLRGEPGLLEIAESGQPAAFLGDALGNILNSHWMNASMAIFAFFAVLTSFLGVSLAMNHFLMDGFGLGENQKGRTVAVVLTYLLPLLFAIYYPQGFILALSYAGTFVAILLGILPALMVWSGRYRRKHLSAGSSYRVIGGRIPLLLIIVFGLFVVLLEWGNFA